MFWGSGFRLGAVISCAAGLLTLVPGAGHTDQVKVSTALGTPVVLADRSQTVFLKVGLTGLKPAKAAARPPINAAIVLDRSGSMSGEKIAKAREAARFVVERLESTDIVSVVIFDDTVQVLVPATRLTDRAPVIEAISRIQPGGSTALFGGVSKGAAEVRKFKDKNAVNRVILLSDGQANVGPATSEELGELGASLKKEGITVSTIGLGLGYHEDLMAQLAQKSDGNHAFVADAGSLKRIFDLELGDICAVVARDVEARIDCAPGLRPVRVLGREGTIDGQSVFVSLSQLYSAQEAYLVLEGELSPGKADTTRLVASVRVKYSDLASKESRSNASEVHVRFTRADGEVAKATDGKAMSSAVELVAAETSKLALSLRDQGKIAEAKKVIKMNEAYLIDNARRYNASNLYEYGESQRLDAANLEGANWKSQRKAMIKWQQFNREAARR